MQEGTKWDARNQVKGAAESVGSRQVSDMHPDLREKYELFDAGMKEAGIPYMLTNVARNVLEQMSLYVQGRLPVRDVNRFRKMAGMPAIVEKENKVVTWTLDSKHVTNMLDKDLNNDFSNAFDIAILTDGKPVWDMKVNVNVNNIPDYEEVGKIGEAVGLTWGGRFNDYCHLEI
jgi:hypothetical protein